MSDNCSSLVNLSRPIALQAYVFNFGWLAEAARG
jgi:hypothetical protein